MPSHQLLFYVEEDEERELVNEDYTMQDKRLSSSSSTYYLQDKCNILSALPKVTNVASCYQRSQTFLQDRQITGTHCISFGHPLCSKILLRIVLLNYVTFFFFWYITEICSKLFLQ
jgi:hypothetical protein